jgi:hypothetical protein
MSKVKKVSRTNTVQSKDVKNGDLANNFSGLISAIVNGNRKFKELLFTVPDGTGATGTVYGYNEGSGTNRNGFLFAVVGDNQDAILQKWGCKSVAAIISDGEVEAIDDTIQGSEKEAAVLKQREAAYELQLAAGVEAINAANDHINIDQIFCGEVPDRASAAWESENGSTHIFSANDLSTALYLNIAGEGYKAISNINGRILGNETEGKWLGRVFDIPEGAVARLIPMKPLTIAAVITGQTIVAPEFNGYTVTQTNNFCNAEGVMVSGTEVYNKLNKVDVAYSNGLGHLLNDAKITVTEAVQKATHRKRTQDGKTSIVEKTQDPSVFVTRILIGGLEEITRDQAITTLKECSLMSKPEEVVAEAPVVEEKAKAKK